MEAQLTQEAAAATKVPWNKGKMIGSKPPLRIKNVWSIRTKLQVAGRLRDLAMFNLAIDSKLRGCDVVTLRVEDIAPHGTVLDRATVRQRKTGDPVRFELTEQTREAIDAYMKETATRPGDYLFPSRRLPGRPLTIRQYARLVFLACTWFRRHQVRVFNGTGGRSWKDDGSRESSRLRQSSWCGSAGSRSSRLRAI